MKVAILLENQYQVLEVWYPFLRFREEGIETVLVGTDKTNYLSKEGYPAQETIPVKKARSKDFEGVIVPGGYAPDYLRRHAEINQFVKNIFESGKLTAAICHGGWVLVSAGILKKKRVTSFMAIKDDMINAGAEYLDQEVVVDNNLITSRNPYDLPAFCREIISFLKSG
ncbi:MAG: type 1 glutamine amidotransferase domain-containing protein [bacterium]